MLDLCSRCGHVIELSSGVHIGSIQCEDKSAKFAPYEEQVKILLAVFLNMIKQVNNDTLELITVTEKIKTMLEKAGL